MLGVGMAVAIIIDATIVRGVLLPAALALLGDRAWTLAGARSRRRSIGDAAVPRRAAEAQAEPPADLQTPLR